MITEEVHKFGVDNTENKMDKDFLQLCLVITTTEIAAKKSQVWDS